MQRDLLPVGPALHSGESVRPQLAQLRGFFARELPSDEPDFFLDPICNFSKSDFLFLARPTRCSFSSRSFLLIFCTAQGIVSEKSRIVRKKGLTLMQLVLPTRTSSGVELVEYVVTDATRVIERLERALHVRSSTDTRSRIR